MGNSETDPMFVDAAGCDGVAGTADDDVRLAAGSLGVDAGRTFLLPTDLADLDGDGNASEAIPFDVAGNGRVLGRAVDVGAYELGGVNTGENVECAGVEVVIPTVSEWGILTMSLMLLAFGTIVLRRPVRM